MAVRRLDVTVLFAVGLYSWLCLLILAASGSCARYACWLGSNLHIESRPPRMVRERKEISPPVRIHPFKAHLVVHRIMENGSILVIRIRHGHEDWGGDPL
ncbi:type II toxin-antitoxin system RelE/ParE family toxin (plasmid) [Agrobacterium tumefaciens]|nr:type II toxin-antitoxin system RelE/ParE family toxin [Agrobacterium tumefaciens]